MKEVKKELLSQANEKVKSVNNIIDDHLDYLFNKQLDSNSLNIQNDLSDEFKNQLISQRMNAKPTIIKDSIEQYRNSEFNKMDRMMTHFISIVNSEIRQEEDLILKASGFEVEIQKKYSIPVACLLFIFVGCPLGIITRGGNFGMSAAISLGFYIVYWVFLLGGEKLADRGFIMPEISMWIGNIVIGFIGLILTYRVSNESSSIRQSISKLFKR